MITLGVLLLQYFAEILERLHFQMVPSIKYQGLRFVITSYSSLVTDFNFLNLSRIILT